MTQTENPNYAEMYERAMKIALRAHEGQTRWGGEPYISHPVAVADSFGPIASPAKVTAVLHDVLEDSDVTEAELREVFPDCGAWRIIVDNLLLLTHKEGESYADYIMRIRTSGLARLVKAADIKHNLSDLGEKHKQRRDKYELALKLLDLP